MPEISVIVPVYNVEPYLHRCVDSILAQTFTDFELILVDDGSPDGCPAICDEYAAKDCRVRVIHQENGGLSSARNAGLDIAAGNYFAFIDSDDYVYSEYLAKLLKEICDNHADISVCGMVEFYTDVPPLDNKISTVDFFSGIEMCTRICNYQTASGFVAACGKLYSKHLFDTLRFPIGRVHEDQFVSHKLFYTAKKIAVLSDKLYAYYYNPNSITKKGFSLKRYDNVVALEEAQAFYKEKDEFGLANQADELKQLIIAIFSITAREKGIYAEVNPRYKMSLFKAGKLIRNNLGYEHYEWFISKLYPNLMIFQARIRKILYLFQVRRDTKSFGKQKRL